MSSDGRNLLLYLSTQHVVLMPLFALLTMIFRVNDTSDANETAIIQ